MTLGKPYVGIREPYLLPDALLSSKHNHQFKTFELASMKPVSFLQNLFTVTNE